MKIVKMGAIPEDKVYICTCKHCKTQVELTLKDPEVTYDMRDGRPAPFSYACPLCHTTNYGDV